VLLAGVAGLLYGLLPRSAGATSGTITECTETQLRADATAGGSYTFSCSGTIILSSALLVSHEVSLTAMPPNAVTIDGYNPAGSQPKPGAVDRIFTVANGGSLELTGLDLSYGLVSAAPVSTPTQGKIGLVGCLNSRFGYEGGECGPLPLTPTNFGEAGSTPGGPGGNGGNSPTGGSSAGGCILIEQGAAATLVGDTLSGCAAEGSSQKWLNGTGPHPGTEGIPGYEQGIGGFGGEGGDGSSGFPGGRRAKGVGHELCVGEAGEAPTPAGAGGDGTNGGNGGNGSEGGAGRGGAIYDAGSLIVQETTFTSDRAVGGDGGAGGNGGRGGNGGNGAEGGEEWVTVNCGESESGFSYPGSDGANGSYGGDGGDGGAGGTGEGGAIYAQGYLAITDSAFHSDLASGGGGGTAGLGGEGGQGGSGGQAGDLEGGNGLEDKSGGNGGASGDGGNAGNSGNGGAALGGGVFYATGSTGALPDAASVLTGNVVNGGSICDHYPATSEECGTAAGPGGHPGAGGRSTPCKNVQAERECPEAPAGAHGNLGAAGVIGVMGIAEGEDVFGAPGSGEPPAKNPGGGSSNGGGSSSGGSSSGGSSGGSGSSANTSTPTPHAGSASASGNSISTSVGCTGTAGQSCSVTATITAQETLNGGKLTAVTSRKGKHPSKVRHITVTLGTVTATIAAGSTRKLTVSLSSTGLRLLSSRHSLPVRFTVTSSLAGAAKAGTAPSVLEQSNLTLRAAHTKGKH